MIRFFGLLTVLSIVALCTLESPALAQAPRPEADYGPNSMSLAGAYSTGGLDMEAFRGNPANLSYRFGQSGFGGGWQRNPSEGSSWQVSTIDGARSIVNGIHFQWWDQSPRERKAISLGGAYRTSYGTAGASSSFIHHKGFSEGNGWHFTTAFGILTPAFHGLTLGASIKNLLDKADKKVLPPELALGLNFHQKNIGLHFQADRRFRQSDAEWSFTTSGELVLKQFFSFRGGYRFEKSSAPSFYSLGFALLAPKLDFVATITRTRGDDPRWGYGFHSLFLF